MSAFLRVDAATTGAIGVSLGCSGTVEIDWVLAH